MLTKKQELFCLEYLKDFNATRAYKEVYRAKQNTAEVNGAKLLRNAKVSAYLRDKADEKLKKADVTAERVIQSLVEVANRCMQKVPVMTKGKEPKQVQERVEDENGNEVLANVRRFDSAGANSALEKLGKYLKLFTDKVELSGEVITWITIKLDEGTRTQSK